MNALNLKHTLLPSLFALTMLFSAWTCNTNTKPNDANKTTKVDTNDAITNPAPIIEKVGIEDMVRRFEENDKGVYVYNFWATWCKPCVAEMPYFEEMAANYADKGVKLVFISLDYPEIMTTKVQPFIEKKGIQSESWLLDAGELNSNQWIDRITPEWQGSIPATFVINHAKKHQKFYEQEFTYEELEEVVKAGL